jgi:hypothetical protein
MPAITRLRLPLLVQQKILTRHYAIAGLPEYFIFRSTLPIWVT